MNALTNFAFEENLVRVVMQNDEPWFVGKDICACLSLKNHNDALASLDDDEKGVATTDPLSVGGAQNTVIVSEPGVYRLVFRSRKPEAERFRRWLAHEVLPALRKTGRYDMTGGADGIGAGAVSLMNEPLGAKVDFLRWIQKGRGFEVAVAYMGALGLPPLPAMHLPQSGADGVNVVDAIARHIGLHYDLAQNGDLESQLSLEAIGAKMGEGGLWLANPAMATLFAGTDYANNWLNALRSLPGVMVGGRMTINGQQVRTTFVPQSVINDPS